MKIIKQPEPTQQIPEADFDALIVATTPDNNATDNVIELCKEYILLTEQETKAKARKEILKPRIDALRTLEGAKKAKVSFFAAAFRNIKGRFKINHIESKQQVINVEVLDKWLAAKKITKKQYDSVVTYSDKSYNLITFQGGIFDGPVVKKGKKKA